MRHVRYVRDGRIRIAVEAAGGDRFDEALEASTLDVLTNGPTPSGFSVGVREPVRLELENVLLLTPLDPPEVWGAGVTYERSPRAGRDGAVVDDVYARASEADRPELFFKDAMWRRTVGPGQAIAVRSDSTWNVPEPEIALVLGHRGTILGVTIGNDVSSRAIEVENPLYLTQAKAYASACAIGPAIYVPATLRETFEVAMRITDASGAELYAGATSTTLMRRGFEDLVAWLVRENPVPAGSVLLTGTGLVPPDTFSLQPGHRVEIHVPQIGTLANPVVSAANVA
jgi:2-dehydro-3-deoxy-D-arabinonate dehydratase